MKRLRRFISISTLLAGVPSLFAAPLGSDSACQGFIRQIGALMNTGFSVIFTGR